MKHGIFHHFFVFFVSALFILSGCTRPADNGEKTTDTPAAAKRPQTLNQPRKSDQSQVPVEAKAAKTAKTSPQKPHGITADETVIPGALAPSSGVAEPQLKPLTLSLPQEKSPPPRPLPTKAAENDTESTPPLDAGSTDVPRTNPLRSAAQPTAADNPIRRNGVEQPLRRQPLRGQPLQTRPLSAKPPANRPLADVSTTVAEPLSQAEPSSTGGMTSATVNDNNKKTSSTFDPIKENGPIFVDWPRPKLAVVITGREDGYLEPCGCAGLDRMKGGLSRRHTMIEQLRQDGWPLLCVDVGGLSKGYGVQAELKFQITVDAMKKMGYQAVGFSPNDLRLPVDSLVAVAADCENNPSPFISANVGLLGFDAGITAQWRVVEISGIKIGVTSVLGKSFAAGLAGDDVEIDDPQTALARVVHELQRRRCRLMILLAYASIEESTQLSKMFPEFAVVVTAGGPPTPPAKPTIIPETKSLLIEVGEKGMDAIVLGIYTDADAKEPYRYQRVPLDSRFAASLDMKNLMIAYQDRLRSLGLAGLAIKPVTHPSQTLNGRFVGSAACESCHEESYQVWKRSGHAKAWSTLLEADPPRDADPECISCHVTGWHPTKHFPYKSGFLGEQQTPKMLNVGCESCHGPGEAHVKAEMGSDKQLQQRMLKTVRVTKQEAKNLAERACQNCHDLDNSPDFKFDTYWPKVEHTESE